MGLLDQVLGQVIGNMAGGGQGRAGGASQGGGMGGGIGDILGQVLGGGGRGAPQGGAGGGIGDLLGQVLRGGAGSGGQAQAPAPSGGGGPLGGALGNILGGAGGKLSPLVLAVLAVLASKHLSSGGGGLGTILHDMLGGGGKSPDGERPEQAGYGREPEGYAGDEGYGEPPEHMRAPPYEQAGGGRNAGGGGFLNDIGSMLDGPGGPRQQPANSGGVLGGDFDDLRQRFDQNGQGGLVDSWIGHGANREPSAGDLEQALGPQAIDQLSRQFGIDRSELLEQLSRALPQVVDGLTPNGRAPTPQEQKGWL